MAGQLDERQAEDARAVIWLLLGRRAGDNAQVEALGALLVERLRRRGVAARLEAKPLEWTPARLLPNWMLPPTLAVLGREARGRIAPPWPDLVIGVGRRQVPVARYVQRQAQRQAQGARLVWLGRPRAPLRWFDLVLTTAQYGLPAEPNVVELELPPALAMDEDAAEVARWREAFAELPRPRIGVLVGGARWPLMFDAQDAQRLGRGVMALAEREGGSWIVSTSPRTGARQARALHEVLKPPGRFHFWRAGDGRGNPHRALPHVADCFVVTADSASMIAEAVRSGRPVWLFPLSRMPLAPRWGAERGVARWLAIRGLLTPPRDMRRLCERLVACGAARWLEDGAPPPPEAACRVEGAKWREKGLETALERIASWLAER